MNFLDFVAFQSTSFILYWFILLFVWIGHLLSPMATFTRTPPCVYIWMYIQTLTYPIITNIDSFFSKRKADEIAGKVLATPADSNSTISKVQCFLTKKKLSLHFCYSHVITKWISQIKKTTPNINCLTSASLRLRKIYAVAMLLSICFILWAVSFLYMGDNGSPQPTITCSFSESLSLCQESIVLPSIRKNSSDWWLDTFACTFYLRYFKCVFKFSKLSFLIMFASNFSWLYYHFVYRPPFNTVLKLHFYF